MRYQRVEVSERSRGSPPASTASSPTRARPEHFAPEPPAGAVRMAPYLRALEAAFGELGEGQWELFLRTTGLPPVELIEPQLVRDEIPPGNPRDW